jgi:hypothetical protein
MNSKDLTPGDLFEVICSPPSVPCQDGSTRGHLPQGEVLAFDYFTHNRYDGFFMVFFKPTKDGSERVWIGDYGETEQAFFDRWETFFKRIP